MNIIIPPSMYKISLAFFCAGFSKLGIELLTASIPVIAEHPEENALNNKIIPIPLTVSAGITGVE